MIRCCGTQTRCLRGASRCRRAGESNITNADTQMSPYLVDTSPHTTEYIHIYHKQGGTLLSQAPHINESILFHEPSSRSIIVTCPSCNVYPTGPERWRTPTAELHHSGTSQIPSKIRGNCPKQNGNPIFHHIYSSPLVRNSNLGLVLIPYRASQFQYNFLWSVSYWSGWKKSQFLVSNFLPRWCLTCPLACQVTPC